MPGFLDINQQMDAGNQTDKKQFIGKVVVNDDPKKLHRIKCEVPELWNKYSQEQLPWISPTGLICGIGTEVQQWIPETGTEVYVTLQSGDSHNPVYSGGAVTSKKKGTVLDTNYPHRVGWYINSFKEQHSGSERERKHSSKSPVNPAGHHYYLDRSTNDLEYKHPSGTYLHIYPNGRVLLSSVDNIEFKAAKDILMDAGGRIESNAGSHIGDYAPRIDHN